MEDARLHSCTILVVDDEPANVALLEGLLSRWGYEKVVGTTDPSGAVALCSELEPDLVLLDLAMPGIDGFQVLQLLERLIEGPVPLPVLVLTADITSETKHRALASGARDFLTKPFDHDEVRLRVANLLQTRRLQSDLKEYGDHLEQRVRERTYDLELARFEVLERLARAAEYRDDDTQEHAVRIGTVSAQIATEMGLDDFLVEQLKLAAPLHDIGKIGVPDAILLKAGPLTSAEREVMQRHAVIGANILSGSRSELMQLAEDIARTHHEWWDGSGYPYGLASNEIPLAGRIVAVADVFDALTHDRPYKDAWPVDRAIEEIVAQGRTQFDPAVVEAFERLDHHELVSPQTHALVLA
jgi:putative two-component system response regulator